MHYRHVSLSSACLSHLQAPKSPDRRPGPVTTDADSMQYLASTEGVNAESTPVLMQRLNRHGRHVEGLATLPRGPSRDTLIAGPGDLQLQRPTTAAAATSYVHLKAAPRNGAGCTATIRVRPGPPSTCGSTTSSSCRWVSLFSMLKKKALITHRMNFAGHFRGPAEKMSATISRQMRMA